MVWLSYHRWVWLLPHLSAVLPIASLLPPSCQQHVVLHLSGHCQSRPPHGPLRNTTYLSLALRTVCKVDPVPAPAVSPIIPLHPLLPYILSVLDVLTLSLPRTYADALPLPWKGLLPHLHLANAHLPLKAHFKCDLFLRPFIFHPNLIWPLSPLLAIIFSFITLMLYFWNANSFYSTLSSAREKSVSYPLST